MGKIQSKIAIVFICFFVLGVFSGCGPRQEPTDPNNSLPLAPDPPQSTYDKEPAEEYEELYDFDLIYTYKNTSNDDIEKVRALVSQLQYGKELPINLIKYDEKTVLRVDFSLGLTEGQSYNVSHTKRMADAVMLFALQDDLDAVLFNFVQANYSYGGVSITREQAEEVFGESIEALGQTKDLFLSKMPEKIAKLKWEPDVMSIISYEHIMF